MPAGAVGPPADISGRESEVRGAEDGTCAARVWGQRPCPVFSPPHFAFATADIGWWTYGACGHGAARPLVSAYTGTGPNSTPSVLPAPAGGWAAGTFSSGRPDLGAPFLIPTRAGTTIVVPLSVGTSRLVVERSLDMGRTWRIAGMVDTHSLPLQSTPADWFDPVNALDWVVAAPGGLIEPTDASRSWTLMPPPVAHVRSAFFIHLAR